MKTPAPMLLGDSGNSNVASMSKGAACLSKRERKHVCARARMCACAYVHMRVRICMGRTTANMRPLRSSRSDSNGMGSAVGDVGAHRSLRYAAATFSF